MRNIAFVGPMHSGKTTAANYLVEHYGYQRIALADGVKQLASDMLTECAYLLTGNCKHPTVEEINQNKATFRPFLQWLGTDFVREYLGMPTYWIDSFLLAAQESTKPVVCDDVRFFNEAIALRWAGFDVIRLIRDEDSRQDSVIKSGGDPATFQHVSETELTTIPTTAEWRADSVIQLRQLIDIYTELEPKHDTTSPNPDSLFAGTLSIPNILGTSHLDHERQGSQLLDQCLL